MLRLISIRKYFGATRAVESVHLEICEGEFFGVVGPSGCGKTTVLRLIAGLEAADGGRILMGDSDWTHVPPQQRDVAMVFQQYALYPHRTVRGNIEYPLRVRRVASPEREERVKRIADLLGIGGLLERKPRQLSGGEAQRVALARALVREPACFLMDEPLSNLDAQLRIRARGEIKRLQRKLRVTTVYVTHDQEEAIALADRIAIMNEGRLVQVGTPEELFQRPATSFVARFLGKPPMNLVQGKVVAHEQGSTVVGLESASGRNDGVRIEFRSECRTGKLLVGFRPEHLELVSADCRRDTDLAWKVPGEVVLVEGLEPDCVAHCDTPAGTLHVRTRTKVAEGPARIILPASKAHFFDAETGNRIE